ncbi:Asp-tRNA(Asn)/Glu-tRNA(Gln) amidotransferase subunit GatC [Desulforudis sp. 1088]|uniref:Asp-tRNA(Asn)/Glu-tRNA(Gln) amidotransferase subunit GatC n=1 Tax=unclassified Candidatus Desulforudis TaxID=2635950 RepID=UPI003CE52D3A
MLTRKDVQHVALLARLELTPEEEEMYTSQLGRILDYARILQDLDTGEVPPTAHVLPLQNIFREDEVGEHLDVEDVLANAPDRKGNFFRVPKIV